MICKRSGTTLPSWRKPGFCPKCGKKIKMVTALRPGTYGKTQHYVIEQHDGS